MTEVRPLIGVGGIIFRDNRVLLVQRGKPPGVGRWSTPGGHQEWGESARAGAIREVREETGVICSVRGFVGYYDAIGPVENGSPAYHFTLLNFWGDWVAGDPVAADDAQDAGWVTQSQMRELDMWNETRDAIATAWKLRG